MAQEPVIRDQQSSTQNPFIRNDKHLTLQTHKNPVIRDKQEPNIRNAQEPNIRNQQEPNIRNAQTTANYRTSCKRTRT